CIDLVAITVADEHRALVSQAQRARIGDAADEGLDPEAVRQLQVFCRQPVLAGGERWWRQRLETNAYIRIGRAADDATILLRQDFCRPRNDEARHKDEDERRNRPQAGAHSSSPVGGLDESSATRAHSVS